MAVIGPKPGGASLVEQMFTPSQGTPGPGKVTRTEQISAQQGANATGGERAGATAAGPGPGPAGPDYQKEWESLTFRNSIEGGFEGFKHIRDALIAKFGTLEQANSYYAGVGGSSFLGHSPVVHKASLGAKLSATEKLLKDKGWYDAIVAAHPGVGGFNVRTNRNNPKALSDHSFGWAIDIDPELNPNVQQFPEGLVRGITGQGMYTGDAHDKIDQGGTAAELLPWINKMRTASDDFKAAFDNETTLKTAMIDYLTGPLGMAIVGKDFDLETVKGAKENGGAAAKKLFGDLVTTLSGAHPDLDKAHAEQLDEEKEAYVHQHSLKAWQAELARRAAAKKKADDKHAQELAAQWKKANRQPTEEDLAAEAAKVKTAEESDVATKAARFLVQMYDVYVRSYADMKKGKRTAPQVMGNAGSMAANGFINLKAELVAALTGSDGGNLAWLGNETGTKDFMHFELKSGDHPALK